MKKNKSIYKAIAKNEDYRDTTEKKIKKKDCSRQSYFKKQNGNQKMKSASNEEVSLIRFYIDEIIFSIEIETSNDENQFYTVKRSIYGLLNQLKLQQEIICDKENESVLFLRMPHLGIIFELRESSADALFRAYRYEDIILIDIVKSVRFHVLKHRG